MHFQKKYLNKNYSFTPSHSPTGAIEYRGIEKGASTILNIKLFYNATNYIKEKHNEFNRIPR